MGRLSRLPGFASGSVAKDVYTFDAHGLVTGDDRYLNEGSGWSLPATTVYTYQADSGRYDNGAPKWGKVQKVGFDSWFGPAIVTGPDGAAELG